VRSARQKTESLVEAIEMQLTRKLNTQVREAFLQVPRQMFLTHIYQQQGNRLAWDYIATPTPEEIYRDEALVTRIDEKGVPTSSSSQPSVMARQLELLNLRPGLSVLEIGTGTGYNAALMGVLVGPTGQVTSMDIEPDLVESAIQHLRAAGITNVLAVTGNGFQGYPDHAPYDRLLATCAVRALPRTWLAQLVPDGLLLANVRFHLSSVFLLLRKATPTIFDGDMLDLNATYMEMRNPAGLPSSPQVDWSNYDSQPRQEIPLPMDLTALLARPAYSLLLECLLPSLRKKYRAFPAENEVHTYLLDVAVPGTAIQVQGDHATIIGGQEYLKTRLLQSIEWYKRFSLVIEDYSILLDDAGATLHLGDMHFPLEI
jgi:protein-L-isoaspartate(D-aspartate) O-methyltransferase